MPTHDTPANAIDLATDSAPAVSPVQWNLLATPQEAVRLIDEWIADDSGYDEQVWPELKAGLERERAGMRSLFRE